MPAIEELNSVQEVAEPNLVTESFPHSAPPYIQFSEEAAATRFTHQPGDVAQRDIHITDTTFRDGQQARPPYSVEEMVAMYNLLAKLSGSKGIIRQTECFLYSKKDREAVDKMREQGHKFPEITGWIRADAGDLHLVEEMKLQETGMLTSCSDYHIFKKLKMDRKKAFEKYTGLAKAAIDKGIRPRCHLEDVTRADIDGFVVPYVEELMRISEDAPDELKVKVRLCDTMGFGLPYPGTILPRSVPGLIQKMIDAGVPCDRMEWHGHNDFHKVLVNGVTAWLYGCNALNGVMFGIGERTGNPPVEGAIMEYIGIKQDMMDIDTTVITELNSYFRSIGGEVPTRMPFVGDDAFMTSAGIHAGGLKQDERIYNIFDTTKLLNRPPRMVLTDKSGTDGVDYWVNLYLGLINTDGKIRKSKQIKIIEWVDTQYKEGRTTAISDAEMIALVKEHLPEAHSLAVEEGRLSSLL